MTPISEVLIDYDKGEVASMSYDGNKHKMLSITIGKSNRVAFEDEAPSTHRMKIIFLCTLWSWVNLYSVDNTDSLVDFFDLVGVYVSLGVFLGSLLCTSIILFGSFLLFFLSIYCFLLIKKKGKSNSVNPFSLSLSLSHLWLM